jgi:hypothetical protein
MKILLLNDTAQEANAGSRGTQRGLRELLARGGGEIVRSVKVHFGQRRFEAAARQRRPGLLDRLHALGRGGAAGLSEALEVDAGRWESCAREWESDIEGFFGDVELVVLNGEGTLHRNRASALSLLALARAALRRDLPLWVVNATLQDMSPDLLIPILRASAHVAVREPLSHRWLSQLGFTRAELASDCLFLLADLAPRPAPDGKRCLYTPGILGGQAAPSGFDEQATTTHIRCLREAGYEPTYLIVAPNDKPLLAPMRRLGVNVMSVEHADPEGFFEMVARWALVVTGRFHVAVYSWLAGLPVVCLATNTWKTSGLLEAHGSPQGPARTQGEFEEWLHRGGFRPEPASIREAIERAKRNVPVTFGGSDTRA